jgi:MFS family permease
MQATPHERALRALFLIQLLSMGAMDMSGPFWPLHLRTLGALSPQQLGWASALVYAGPMAAAMCVGPAWGALADRVGHKPMLLRALVALCLTQLWIAWADSVASVVAARIVQGAFAGFLAASQAYGAQLVPRDRRAWLMARLQVATALGSMGGPFLGGVLYGAVGFRAVNLLATAVCALCAAAAWWLLPGSAAAGPSGRRARTEGATPAAVPPPAPAPLVWSTLAGLLLGIVLVQSARMLPQSFFGLYAEQVLALPPWGTGVCWGLTALGLCLAAPWWGRRLEQRPAAQVLRTLEGVAWACVALALLQCGGIPLALVLAARFGWGLCLGALLPVFQALLSREAPAARQGQVLGWAGSAAKAGALAGTALGGVAMALLPLPWLMGSVAATYAVAALGLRGLRRRAARHPPTPDTPDRPPPVLDAPRRRAA